MRSSSVRGGPPPAATRRNQYGLNLSRAWQFRRLASGLPAGDPRTAAFREAAEHHLEAGLPHVTGNGFVSDHRLATYAFLALTT